MTTEPDPPFEDALERLEAIVDDLEGGAPGLSEALAKYEQGVRLLAHCHGVLDRAEQSVALLTGVDDAGRPLTAPLDPPADEAPAPPSAPRKGGKRRPAADDDGDASVPF